MIRTPNQLQMWMHSRGGDFPRWACYASTPATGQGCQHMLAVSSRACVRLPRQGISHGFGASNLPMNLAGRVAPSFSPFPSADGRNRTVQRSFPAVKTVRVNFTKAAHHVACKLSDCAPVIHSSSRLSWAAGFDSQQPSERQREACSRNRGIEYPR